MANRENTQEASLPLLPDAWRTKTQGGYSVTEGMEYEPFTEQFRYRYDRIQEKKFRQTNQMKTDIFTERMEIHTEEKIRERLFTEVKDGKKREDTQIKVPQHEILIGTGFMILLFVILLQITLKRKKRKFAG